MISCSHHTLSCSTSAKSRLIFVVQRLSSSRTRNYTELNNYIVAAEFKEKRTNGIIASARVQWRRMSPLGWRNLRRIFGSVLCVITTPRRSNIAYLYQMPHAKIKHLMHFVLCKTRKCLLCTSTLPKKSDIEH